MMIITANNLIIEIVIIITIILFCRGSLLNSCAMASGLGIALAYLVQRPQSEVIVVISIDIDRNNLGGRSHILA